MTMQIADSVLDTIGRTPTVRLRRLTAHVPGDIYAKLEFFNPGLSKKDRIAKQIIEDAERSGDLRPGQVVVELTSGNAGTGLAIACAVKGYPFVAVMSRGNSVERRRMILAFGAELILVDQAPGSVPGRVSGEDLELVEQRTREVVDERQAFRADQFSLRGNVDSHRLGTGAELVEQLAGKVDGFCDFVGSGGSFFGCSAALKACDPDIRCYVVEPAGAAVLAGQAVTNPNHVIQGGGYARADLGFLDPALIDGYLQVSDQDAVYWARELARTEGILGGFSTGANIAAGMHLLNGDLAGGTIAVIASDSGLKYLSTDLWPDADRA